MDEQKFCILIVDDEKTNLNVLNHILKDDYTIYIAKSGKSALKRAREFTPDLILLDIMMPDVSGFDVLHELKESDQTRGIPVIFITGLSKAEDEEKGFLLGAVDYITKPFTNSIVKARIRNQLQIVKHIRTIEKLGLIDPLTDIANRRYFDNQINTEWQRAIINQTPISLLFMDVDKFKVYNDTYGHPKGDELLQRFAKIFKYWANGVPNLAARLGGEEFAVLLINTDLNSALKTAESIRANVEDERIPHKGMGENAVITISIGVISKIPQEGDDPKPFITAADKALYKAKNEGRNRVCTANESESGD